MRLVKENIHRIGAKGTVTGCETTASFTLDDDFNVPDVKPDAKTVIREMGTLRVLEKKCTGGRLHVRGILTARVLFLAEDGSGMYGMENEIPFDEMIHMNREECKDVTVHAELDDITATLVHSRKINVKALVTVRAMCEEVTDEIVVTETEGKGLLARAKDVNFTNLSAVKKDTIRIREEVPLPASKPNIGEVIYKELNLVMNESRVLDGELMVKGVVEVFLIYRGGGLKDSVEFFETKVPFSEQFELSGAAPEMIEDVTFHVILESMDIRPDEDGEERIIGIEIVPELDIKLYEEKELMVLDDIYSLSGEVALHGQEEVIPRLLMKNQGIGSFSGTQELTELAATPMQISRGSVQVHLEKITPEEEALTVEGMLEFRVMFVTGSDERPFVGTKFYAPFEHRLNVNGLDENCTYKVTPMVTDSSFQLYRSNEVEWKAEVNFQSIVFCNEKEYMVTDAEFTPFSPEEEKKQYSVIGYVSEEGDTLWSVGKRFHLSPEEVAKENDLEEELIPKGKMLLLVRSSISEEV